MAKRLREIPVSMLDFATLVEGDKNYGDAFRRSLRFVQEAEQSGYQRYWFTEHHNMESVASSAPVILLGHMAAHSTKIKLGAGGIMLPNHVPYVIAEQFGTLDALYPGRFDIALGRAPGTDQITAKALRRFSTDPKAYPRDVLELLQYLHEGDPQTGVKAIPGHQSNVPVWLLGSSTYSAQLAGMLGLPFAFAAHFAPAQLMDALEIYRESFKPSSFLQKPYTMACVQVICADTETEAEYLASSLYQMVKGMFRDQRKPLPPPVRSLEGIISDAEMVEVRRMLWYSFFGDKEALQQSLQSFVNQTAIDELMISTVLFDEEIKCRSMKEVATLFKPAE